MQSLTRQLLTMAAAGVVIAPNAAALGAGAFSSPVQNSFTINFDDASAASPGPLDITGLGFNSENYDNSLAGEESFWGSFSGAPDSIVADIVEDDGPDGLGDNAARLTVTDATPGGYFSGLRWQVKGLVLGNSSGATASGDEPIPDFDNGLTLKVPVKVTQANAEFRINFDSGAPTRAGRYEDGNELIPFIQGNVPGLIENFGAGSRVIRVGTDTSPLQPGIYGTEQLVDGVPLALDEAPSAANGWSNATFEPFFFRAPRSFNLTRVGVTFPGGGGLGELFVSEWTMSGPDVLKYHAADFNYDEMVDAADIDMLYDALAALALNESLPPVPDNNFNGALDFEPVFGVNQVPFVDVTLPEKFSITKTDNNTLDTGDVDELVQVILGTEYGDADLDGDVDLSDLLATQRGFGTDAGWAGGDFNGDGTVDGADQALLLGNLGFVATGAAIAAVPEPGSFALVSLLGACLLMKRR